MKEEIKERNTSQLPRLLCWTRVSFVAGASPWWEVERGSLIISGTDPRIYKRLPLAGPGQWDPNPMPLFFFLFFFFLSCVHCF